MKSENTNIIFVDGRITIDKDTPSQISAPFNQIQIECCKSDDAHNTDKLVFSFVDGGRELSSLPIYGSYTELISTYIPAGKIINIDLPDCGKTAEIIIESNKTC